MTIIRSSRTGVPAVLAALVLGALTSALPSTAQAAPAPPQLSIAVDDGRASAAASDRLTYVMTVTNLGTRPLKDLSISQTIPDGAVLESTEPRSTNKAPDLRWSVDVEPGRTATMTTTVTVAETLPDGILRLATVGCARVSAKAPPLVCASDSDQLPAGALADEQRRGLPQPATGEQGWWPLPGAPVLGGLLLVVVPATTLLLLRRRRRRDQHPGGPGPDADQLVDLVPSSRR